MMYKVIHDDYVVDLLTNVTYVKFLKGTSKRTITDRTNADGIIGSDKKTVYVLQGRKAPEGCNYKVVTLHEISEHEYDHLVSLLLITPGVVIANPNSLRDIRETKIQELSAQCHDNIIRGVQVLLSDGFYHHFSLSLEDQVNLLAIEQQIKDGAKNILYHEAGCVARIYSYRDMKTIIDVVNAHKERHQLYFNLVKYCINNMYNREDIEKISYGDDVFSLNVTSDVRKIVEELYHV